MRGELERLPGVRPREVVPGEDRREDALRPHVGALVDPGRATQREQAALGGRGDLDVVHLAARVVRRDEMLSAILDPLHRAAETERGERDEHVLGIELAADAEAAADVDLHEPHVVESEPEQLCEHPAVEVLHLRRAVDRHAAAHRLGEEPARLERRARLPLQLEAAAHDDVRRREGRVHVAEAERDRVDDVRAERLVDERPAGARGDGVAGRVEDVEVELDELGRVLRGPRILGEHERDRLADVAHDLPREDGLEHLAALGRRREREPDRDAHVGDVRRRQDGEHASVLTRRLGGDAEQRRMRDRAADDTRPHLAREV